MDEIKIPKFVIDLTNYLIAIKNLSKVYVTNMQITIQQFLEFINVHKFKIKYDSIVFRWDETRKNGFVKIYLWTDIGFKSWTSGWSSRRIW